MKEINSKYRKQNKNIIKENSVNTTKKRNWLIIYAIIAFIVPVLLYLPTINFGFTHFDDNMIISDNITFLSHFGNVQEAFLTDQFIVKYSNFYRPLGTLSYMVDIQLSGGNNTWMYHLSNILLLGAIACSLFLLLRQFLIPPKLALLGTLIYCVHPLFVSTVAFIANRAELLLIFFSLLSFLFFIELLRKGKIIYLFLNWTTFTIALFCKETAAFLPFLFIIYYFTFLSRKRFDKRYLFNIMLYAISGMFWLWLRSKAIGSVSNRDNAFGLIALMSNLRVIPESLAKFLLPSDITPIPSFSILRTLVGLGMIVMIIIIFLKNKERSKKEKIFCFSWFIILIFPSMLYKISSIDYLDHRFFLPLIGILLFVLFSFPKKWFKKGDIKRTGLIGVIFVFLCSFTFIKSHPYSDPMTFYNSAVSHNTNSSFAYNNRGQIKSDRNDFQGAINDYNKAIAINPNLVEAFYNRGIAKINIGDNLGAIEDYNKAIAINPNLAEIFYNRGIAKVNIGDNLEAIEDYNKAIVINQNYSEAYNNRGIAKVNISNILGAIEDYNKAIAINPNLAKAYYNRGIAKVNIGDNLGAIEDYNKAIAINQNYSEAYNNRGYLKYILHDFQGAIEDYNKTIAICPTYDNGKAHTNRGFTKLNMGDKLGAIADFTRAVEINPNYFGFYINRANAKYSLNDLTGTIEDCEKALKLNPNLGDALSLKAKAQAELQKKK